MSLHGMSAAVRTGAVSGCAGICVMKLCELSEGYRQAAIPLKNRLRVLRRRLNAAQEPSQRAQLRHEIALLSGILTQCRELAELTEHYYERGFYRDGKYTL